MNPRETLEDLLHRVNEVSGHAPMLDGDGHGRFRIVDYDGNNLYPDEGYATYPALEMMLSFAVRIVGG
jgi:hypothetical protein